MDILTRELSRIHPELAVVVPTYCEADNIPELTRRIHEAVNNARISTEIVIVDDNSQDGTDRVCKELATSYPLKLITRLSERGLSGAVIHGIRESRSEYVIVMDADLSHPPEDIPRLLHNLKLGADFVVGSRYVAGASTDAQWSLFRWLNSRAATLLAWGLTNLKDPMAGYFAFPRRILDEAPALLPIGYKIGLEILIKANCRNVIEIPIAFMDRTRGESKLTIKQQLYYIRHLRRLYQFKFPRAAELVHFVAVGGSGVVVDLLVYLVLVHLVAVNHQLARALSFVMAASWNWFLHRWLTFVSGRQRPPGKQWVQFLVAASLGFSINWGTYKVLTDRIPYFMTHTIAAFFTGICLGTMFNYALSRIFVFRPLEQLVGRPRQGKRM
ncbi:MAG: glycosyltransferase family 2 protein [Nitrospira sp.]|nr:glycosyltransferase family 2 protein [Nitrospira sp.]